MYVNQFKHQKENVIQKLSSDLIISTILQLSLPNIIGRIVVSLFSNTIYILISKRFGDYAFTGQMSFQPTEVFFYQNVIVSIAQGASTLVSRYLGQNQIQKAKLVQMQYMWLCLLHSIIVPIVFYPVLKRYLNAIGITEQILPFALQYGQITTILGPLTYSITSGLQTIYICQNMSLVCMIRQISASILSLTANLVLIYCFSVNIQYVQMSTNIINILTGFILAILTFTNIFPLQIKQTQIKFDIKIIFQILQLGVPIFINYIPNNLGSLLSTFLFKNFSNNELQTIKLQRINGICTKICQFVHMPINGLMSGYQPLIGYNLANKNFKRVFQIYKQFYSIIILFSVILCLLTIVFSQLLIDLYCKIKFDDDTAKISLILQVSGLFMQQFLQISTITLQQEKYLTYATLLQSIRALLAIFLQVFFIKLTKKPMFFFYSIIVADICGGILGFAISVFYYFKFSTASQRQNVNQMKKDVFIILI